MSGRRATRYRLVAVAMGLVALAELSIIVAPLLQPTDIGSGGACALDIFGLQLPSSRTDCYRPIGPVVLAVFATLAGAVAVALRPLATAPLAAIASAVLAVGFFLPAMAQHEAISLTSILLALLAAIPFLVFVPSGRTATTSARRAWIAALIVIGLVALFDAVGSGMVAPGLPQLTFVVVASSVLGAGLLAGRLDQAGHLPTAGT